MASNENKVEKKLHNNTKDSFNSNSEEELIDLDKVLPFKLDSNWLMECKGISGEFQDSFSKLQFSNPVISDMVKSVYQTGKSKQVLHQLLYWNEKMTISCDNCAYLYRRNTSSINNNNNRSSKKRHSVALTSQVEYINNSSESLTDSLDSITVADNPKSARNDKNGNVTDRMTQSSITDYDREYCAPTESVNLPMVKGVSTSQNILSRTYDKEDLEILKQTELSKSVFVPHISGSKTDHYSEVECKQILKEPSIVNRRHTFATSVIQEPSIKSSYLKTLFPIATTIKITNYGGRKPRPTSEYQVDKLTKSTIDRCLKMSQIRQNNLNTKKLLQMNENIFETDVLTPINSPRNVKHLIAINQQSRLKRPNTSRKTN